MLTLGRSEKSLGIFLGRKILQKKRNDGYFHPTGSFCSYAELIRCFISNSLRAINPDAASSLLDKNGIIRTGRTFNAFNFFSL